MKEAAALKKQEDFKKQFRRHIPFYLFILPAVALEIIFSYFPMYGLVIAFKEFKMARGILGSDWVGFKYFQKIFRDPVFFGVLWNTIKISFLSLITSFPVTIIFTLLVNEILHFGFKKFVQTVTYMPHFLSWVVVGSFVHQILSPTNGVVNGILTSLGLIDKPIYFMAIGDYFIPVYLISALWKGTGYSIVIYLATIAGIDTQLYDAASIDGANRFQRILHVTLPAMMPTMCTMLILSIGSLVSVGFDPIYNLYTSATRSVADVIATYVYRKAMMESQYSLSTAIGLFQNVVSLGLVMFANWFARRANPEYKII